MHAHMKTLNWDTPVWDTGLDYDRDPRHASRYRCSCPPSGLRPGGSLDFRLHEVTARGYPCPHLGPSLYALARFPPVA